MATLAFCIKKLGLDPDTVKHLRNVAEGYQDQGFSKREGEVQAVSDAVDMIDSEYTSIVSQAEAQVRQAIKAFESAPGQWFSWPFVQRNKKILEDKIRQYHDALFDTKAFVESRFYNYDQPVPKAGGIMAAMQSAKYGSDKVYRKWVDDKIKQITDDILNANKSRLILLGKPISSGLGDFRVSKEMAANMPEPYYAAGSEEASENVEASYAADVDRLWALEAQKLYGERDLGDVGIREAVQNSMDAVMEAIDRGDIKRGKIEVNPHRYESNESPDLSEGYSGTMFQGFEVIDNGIGFASDQMIRDKFLKIAGTGKSKPGRFGGFGIAKAVILKPMQGTAWFLESNNYYFNSEMAEKKRKVADMQKPRKGTKIWVRAPELMTSHKHVQYLETTEPPKGVTLLYNGKKLKDPFARRKAKKFHYRIFEDKTLTDPETGKEVDGSVTYDISYYGNPPDGYDQRMVLRINDKKTGAKLTQGIGSLYGFSGSLVVDITTNATPEQGWYPLEKSRQDLKYGEGRKPIEELKAKFTIDKGSAGRIIDHRYYGVAERPEWRKTLKKVNAQDQGYMEFAAALETIRNDADDADIIDDRSTTAGYMLYTPLDDLSIKIDTGYKGYRGGTMLHAKMLAGYEASARLLSNRLKAPVNEFYGMLSKPMESGGYALAEYGPETGSLGFNFVDVDKTSLKSPLGLAFYYMSSGVHELTHRYQLEHDENFSAAREGNERKAADIFPYILRVAEATLGKKDTDLTKIETKEVPVEKIVTKTETIERIVTNTVKVPVETIVEKEVPKILASRQAKLEFDETKDTEDDEKLYYPVRPEEGQRQRRLFGRTMAGVDAGRVGAVALARPGRGPEQPAAPGAPVGESGVVQLGPITGQPAAEEDLIIPKKLPTFYQLPNGNIMYVLRPEKWLHPPIAGHKGTPGQWTFYQVAADQYGKRRGSRIKGRGRRLWFDTKEEALQEMWKEATTRNAIAVRPGWGGDWVEIAPVYEPAPTGELAFHNIAVGSMAEDILAGRKNLAEVKPAQITKGELTGIARAYGKGSIVLNVEQNKQKSLDQLLRYLKAKQELDAFAVAPEPIQALMSAKNVAQLKKLVADMDAWIRPGSRPKKADLATAVMRDYSMALTRSANEIDKFYKETGREIPGYLKDTTDYAKKLYKDMHKKDVMAAVMDGLAAFQPEFERGATVDVDLAAIRISEMTDIAHSVVKDTMVKAIERGYLYGVAQEQLGALDSTRGLLKHGKKYYRAVGKVTAPRIDPDTLAKKIDSKTMPETLTENIATAADPVRLGRQLGLAGVEHPSVKKALQRASDALDNRVAQANAERNHEEVANLVPVTTTLKTALDVLAASEGADNAHRAFYEDFKANPNTTRNEKLIERALFQPLERISGPIEQYMATRAAKEEYFKRYLRPMGITLDDVARLFHSESVKFQDGQIHVTTRGGETLVIKSVDSISPDDANFYIAYGRRIEGEKGEFIKGKYRDGVISLHRDLSDNWTLTHETVHWMEDVGIIRSNEVDMLKQTIQDLYDQGKWTPANKLDVGNAEDRANYIALKMAERRRDSQMTGWQGWLKRMIQRIQDIVDGFVGMFKLTPQSLVRDIATGQIYRRPKTNAPRFGLAQLMVAAYHGSPHFFRRFKTRFIGTGEGAIAFGWGLYFTDDLDIAKGYADRLGQDVWGDLSWTKNGETISIYKNEQVEDYSPSRYERQMGMSHETAVAKASLVEDILIHEQAMHDHFRRMGNAGVAMVVQDTIDDHIEAKEDEIAHHQDLVKRGNYSKPDTRYIKELREQINWLKKIRPDGIKEFKIKRPKTRAVYKVHLHEGKKPSEYDWLDWDKPVTPEQADKIIDHARYIRWSDEDINDLREAMGMEGTGYEMDPGTGESIYNLLTDTMVVRLDVRDNLGIQIQTAEAKKHASLFLLAAGIDGIRMPSGMLSGIKDSPHFNYVVFDENAVSIQEVEQYAVKSAQQEEFERRHPNKREAEKVSTELTSDQMTFWQKVGAWMQKRREIGIGQAQDTTAWDRLLFTPLHYFGKIPAMKSISEDGFERSDSYYKKLHHIERDPQNRSRIQQIDMLRKANKKEYRQLGQELDQRDMDKYGWKVKRSESPEESAEEVFEVIDPEGTVKATANDYLDGWRLARQLEAQEFKDKGYSDQAVDALIAVRTINDNGFNLLRQSINEMITRYNQKGMELPKVATYIDGERVEVDLKVALARLGDMRGHYMPRIRRPGNWTMYATDPKGKKSPWLENFETKSFAAARAAELEREGYITNIESIKKMPEDVFQAAGEIASFQAIINEALDNVSKDMKKGVAADTMKLLEQTQLKMGMMLAENVANVFKGRGVRQHMIMRNDATGKDVWQGYETDLAQRQAKYARGLAAGEAKKEMALKMLQHFTGTDVPWSEYKAAHAAAGLDVEYADYLDFVKGRRVDPIKQKNAYHDGLTYIQDMLRNDEGVDRMLGMVKGVAVLKYLAGRVSAPLVNLTALATSVPATMSAYANIPLHKTPGLLASGMSGWRNYRKWLKDPKSVKMEQWEIDLYEDIEDRGWHTAQYNKEALSVLKSKVGNKYDTMMEMLMLGFGATEQLNRMATIAGAYKGLRAAEGQRLKDAKSNEARQQIHEEWMAKAKEVSDKAHGVYQKANRPHYARGSNIAARIAQTFYVFKTFSHNYLQTMYDLGFQTKDRKALLYMAVSPAVLGGAAASPLIKLVFEAMDLAGGDEPEEAMYQWLEDNYGEGIEQVARLGFFGMGGYGVSLKGSLEIGITDLPTSLKDFTGAPGSMLYDLYLGQKHIRRGEWSKGLEKVSPNFIGSAIKAWREKTQGITTSSNAPLFFGTEQVKLDWMEALLRGLSFNPARIARIREKQWKERLTEQRYGDMRYDIYAKMKTYFSRPPEKRNKEDWLALIQEAQVYNELARQSMIPGIPLITKKSIKNNIRRAFKPPKKERLR